MEKQQILTNINTSTYINDLITFQQELSSFTNKNKTKLASFIDDLDIITDLETLVVKLSQNPNSVLKNAPVLDIKIKKTEIIKLSAQISYMIENLDSFNSGSQLDNGLTYELTYSNQINNVFAANNKFTNQIFNPFNELIYNEEDVLDVSTNHKNTRVQLAYFIEYDTSMVSISGKPLTAYDRAVYDAVTSHYLVNNTYITPNMICRTMQGKTKNKPSQQQIDAVIQSLNKMKHIHVALDISQELKQYSLQNDDIEKGILDAPLLAFESITITHKNKNITTGYNILSSPILYRYSSLINQVTIVPLAVLDVPVNNTQTNIILKNYLIRRIKGMKSKTNNLYQNTILFESVYTLLEVPKGDALQSSKIRKTIDEIFKYWVENKFINSYEFVKKGRSYHSIVVNYK